MVAKPLKDFVHCNDNCNLDAGTDLDRARSDSKHHIRLKQNVHLIDPIPTYTNKEQCDTAIKYCRRRSRSSHVCKRLMAKPHGGVASTLLDVAYKVDKEQSPIKFTIVCSGSAHKSQTVPAPWTTAQWRTACLDINGTLQRCSQAVSSLHSVLAATPHSIYSLQRWWNLQALSTYQQAYSRQLLTGEPLAGSTLQLLESVHNPSMLQAKSMVGMLRSVPRGMSALSFVIPHHKPDWLWAA